MFKPKSNALQIGQDAFQVPCKNGNLFSQDGIIRFELPRNTGFIDMANSYLSCEIEVQSSANGSANNDRQPMLQLDRASGAQSIISQITTRSEGRVLEENRAYNVYTNLHYCATETEGVKNKRSRLEGCANSYMPQDNPYVTTNKVVPGINVVPVAPAGLTSAADCWKPVRRKVCLPINTGIFNNPQSFPTMAIPLEVEIILEKSLRCLRVADRGDGQTSCRVKDLTTSGAAGTIGRRTIVLEDRAQFNSIGGAAGTVPSNAEVLQDGQQQLSALNNCWWRVGQQVRIDGAGEILNAPTYAAGEGVVCNIVSIAAADNAYAVAGDRGSLIIVVDTDLSNANNPSTGLTINQLSSANAPLAGHGTFNYTVHNPRLVVAKVVPPPAVVQGIARAISQGEYSQDIISYTNIDNAIPASQSSSTNILPIDLSRVKSIISIPTSQSNNDNVSNSNALQGQYLNATEYQWQIDGKLIPDRRVILTREANPAVVSTPNDNTLKPYRLGSFISGFHAYEMEKALKSANINPTSIKFITQNPANTDVVTNNFNAQVPGCWAVSRALGANMGTSQNLVGKSVILYLNYNPNSNMVKLLRNFVIHVRTIRVGMEGVSLFY